MTVSQGRDVVKTVLYVLDWRNDFFLGGDCLKGVRGPRYSRFDPIMQGESQGSRMGTRTWVMEVLFIKNF